MHLARATQTAEGLRREAAYIRADLWANVMSGAVAPAKRFAVIRPAGSGRPTTSSGMTCLARSAIRRCEGEKRGRTGREALKPQVRSAVALSNAGTGVANHSELT